MSRGDTPAELVEFLTARLDEDEATARYCAAGFGARWHIVENGQDIIEDETGSEVLHYDGLRNPSDAAHIARHDPARVLAEVDAKRRILEALEDERQRKDIYNRDYPLGLLTTEGDLRARTSANARWAGLEVAVRLLTAVYVDHPDYPDEWKP
jgi:hypothetical protein